MEVGNRAPCEFSVFSLPTALTNSSSWKNGCSENKITSYSSITAIIKLNFSEFHISYAVTGANNVY